MPPAKIVNIDNYFGGPEGYAHEIGRLEPLGVEFVLSKAEAEDEIIAAARGANVLLYESAVVPITRRVIETLDDCWLIGRYGIGLDSLDIAAATDHRIVVFNAADYCIEEVSDHAVALLLACARHVVVLNRHVQSGGWDGLDLQPPLRRLNTLTLGLLAFGRIPRLVARKMSGFDMRILTADPYITAEVAASHHAERVPMDQLLRESDLISVHTPLTAETHHIIGEAELRTMKPTSFLVNTSRGPVIDEAALVRALQEGWIAGAGLDVTDVEPLPADSPLRGMDNVILTPHHAANSEESLMDLHRSVAESVAAVVRGYWPPFPVNPQVKPRLGLKPYAELAPQGV